MACMQLAGRYFAEGADEVTFLNITGFRDFPLGDMPMLEVCTCQACYLLSMLFHFMGSCQAMSKQHRWQSCKACCKASSCALPDMQTLAMSQQRYWLSCKASSCALPAMRASAMSNWHHWQSCKASRKASCKAKRNSVTAAPSSCRVTAAVCSC